MAGLAAVLRLWVAGREREAFTAFVEFSGVPTPMAKAVGFPDQPFPATPARTPYGDAWLVYRLRDAPSGTKVPVVPIPWLTGFLHDWSTYQREGERCEEWRWTA